MFRIYRTCNLTVQFLKYKFINKLLGCVTLLRVTPGVTWTQPVYICVWEREREIALHWVNFIKLQCVISLIMSNHMVA